MAVTFQHPELAEDLTVMENMQLAAPNLKGPEGRAEAERLLAEVASEQHAMSLKARVRDLTLAQHHVIELARALATKPEALLLDEPTEPFQQADIDKLFDLIKRLREEGVGIVYVSHRLHEIEKLADRITVLRDGRIISTGPAHQITPDQIVTMIAGQPLRQKFPDKSRNVGDPCWKSKGSRVPDLKTSISLRVHAKLSASPVLKVKGSGSSFAPLRGWNGARRDRWRSTAPPCPATVWLPRDAQGSGSSLRIVTKKVCSSL